MIQKKKPDNVVFNTKTQKYDASLKPYPTNVGAPKITTTETVAWKNRSIHKFNQKLQTKYNEIKKDYDKLIQEFENNDLIYNAKFNFEPIIGDTYHLYQKENGENFLSVIAPNQCSFCSLGSFRLNADQTWEKIA